MFPCEHHIFRATKLIYVHTAFLAELEYETSNQSLKKFYRYFGLISIVLFPLTLIIIVLAAIVELARRFYNLGQHNYKEAEKCNVIATKIFTAVSILGPIINVTSCLILALVICLVLRIKGQARSSKYVIAGNS